MFCKAGGKKYFTVLGIVGFISLITGAVMTMRMDEDSHGFSMAAGMLVGLGGALVVIFIIRKLQERFAPDKVKKDDIEKNDERNIQVTRAAFVITGMTAVIYMAGMALVMAFLDFRIGTYICVGGIYVSTISYFIANRIYQKKM